MSDAFELNCPCCDRLYTIGLKRALSLAGRSIRCKKCSQLFRLPDEAEILALSEQSRVSASSSTDSAEQEEALPLVDALDSSAPPSGDLPKEPADSDVASCVAALPPPAPVVHAMPPSTVSDIATIRKWIVALGVIGLLLVTANMVLLVLALIRSR